MIRKEEVESLVAKRSPGVAPPPKRPALSVVDNPAVPAPAPAVRAEPQAPAPAPRRKSARRARSATSQARVSLNIPYEDAQWAKKVASALGMSLAELLLDGLSKHSSAVEVSAATNPPAGRQRGAGPFDLLAANDPDHALRSQLTNAAERAGFDNLSEYTARLLSVMRKDGSYTQRARDGLDL